MIKLKDLLTEEWITHKGKTLWFPAHTKATFDMIGSRSYIALYPKQMESMFGKQPISSFHVTSPNHIKQVGKIIGKKKSISTFTRANNDSPLAKGRGIQTGTGGVIFYVQGTLLATRYMDFDTIPDKTGRRWVDGHFITGDRQMFRKAYDSSGIPKKREKLFDKIYDIKKKYEKEWMEDDDKMPYNEYQKMVEKKTGPFINQFIKEFFNWQNKWLQANKELIKKNLRTPSNKPSAWWNEILIYNTRVIDAFVLSRITKDGMWMQQYGNNEPGPWQKELYSYVPKSKVTIGTPAKFRKWYGARQGIIDQI
jgi:hypothetical protein